MSKSAVKSKAAAKTKTKSKTAARPARVVSTAPEPISIMSPFVVGDRIKHSLFGAGEVIGVRGEVLNIRFSEDMIKEIRADFVGSYKK